MKHLISTDDQQFKDQVQACEFPVPEFDHRAHLGLAYVYLVQNSATEEAVGCMRHALHALLRHAGVDPAEKYHETITRAWILAVHHFMQTGNVAASADAFIAQHPVLLDAKIMLTHSSAELVFSAEARDTFLQSNRDPIPRYFD